MPISRAQTLLNTQTIQNAEAAATDARDDTGLARRSSLRFFEDPRRDLARRNTVIFAQAAEANANKLHRELVGLDFRILETVHADGYEAGDARPLLETRSRLRGELTQARRTLDNASVIWCLTENHLTGAIDGTPATRARTAVRAFSRLDGADASVARATEDARRYRDEARHYERTGSQRVDLDELRLDVTESVTRGVLLLTDALRARDNEPMESSGIPARYDGDPDAPADDERPAHTIDRAATRLDTLRRNVMLDVSDGDAARKAGRALDRRDAELANAPRARSYPDVREVGFY